MTLVATPETGFDTPATSFDDFLAVLDGLRLSPARTEIDLDRKRVLVNGRPVALTGQEFALLAHLALNSDRTVSRTELIDTVWAHRGIDAATSRTVDAHVRRLRAKLDLPDLVTTVRGEGYRFNSSGQVRVIAHEARLRQHTLAA